MEKVRLGVIGTGRLGGFHASKAANDPEVEFVGVSDVSEESRKRVADQWNVRSFETVEELLLNVDAVVLAAPSTLHAEIGRKVLKAGKHLLVEKPATTTGATALELARIAREKNLVLQAGHVEQHNPAWRAARRYLLDVRSGKVPAFVESERTSGYTFRSTDVGVTLDLMIHDIELVLSLIPSEITRASAFGFSQFGGFEDVAFATLEFANGSIASLKASRAETNAVRRTSIRTYAKSLFIDFAARSAKLVRPGREILNGSFAPGKVSYPEMAPRVSTFMQDEYETEELVKEPFDALALEMRDFASAILRGTPSTAPGERAARAVVVAEMIMRDIEARSKQSETRSPQTLRMVG